jgi:hypothetical protein
VALAAAGYLGWQRYGGGDAKVVVQGGVEKVLANVDGGKAEYQVLESGEETYMLFGAAASGDFDSHGWMAAIPIKMAARLKARYPDFTRCDSPGAAEAQNRVENIKIIAAKREHRAVMRRIVSEFDSRISSGGERLCVTVQGTWLALEASEKGGERLTLEQLRQFIPAQALKGQYVMPASFQLRDCKDLI